MRTRIPAILALIFLPLAMAAVSMSVPCPAASEPPLHLYGLFLADRPTPVNISNSATNSTFGYADFQAFDGRAMNYKLLGVDRNGAAYVVWYEWETGRQLYFATNKSGTWSTPQWLDKLYYDDEESGYPNLAVSASGTCHLNYQDGKNPSMSYEIMYKAYENGAWGTTSFLSNTTGASIYCGNAVNPVDNYLYVVWTEYSGGYQIMLKYRSPTGVWSSNQVLPLTGGYFPQIAIDGKGAAHLVWGYIHGRTLWYAKNNTPWNPNTWTSPTLIKGDAGNEWAYPKVACDDAGNAYIVWVNGGDISPAEIFLRKVNSNGTLGPEINVSNSVADSQESDIAVDRANGDILVAWTESHDIYANACINGLWTGTGNVSNTASDSMQPSVALDSNGGAHLVWAEQINGNYEIMYMSLFSGNRGIKNDFNGDGQEDILWRYYGSGGYNYVWYMGQSGSGGTGLQTMNSRVMDMFQSPAPAKVYWDAREAGGLLERTADKVYRDAREAAGSLSWEKAPTIPDGQFGMPGLAKGIRILKTPMENTVRTLGLTCLGVAFLPAVLGLDWQIGGTGDFNGDGKVDILWRYYGTSGYNCVWYMDGVMCIGGAYLPSVTDPNWQIAGTGDFNGDGKTDILWRYYGSAGYNYVWYMDGVTCIGAASLLAVPDPDWKIVGTGDFNGDGKVDILWRYYGSAGYNYVWYMNGVTYTGEAALPSVADRNWQIAGTGDFNRDGKTDILWRYYGSAGYNYVWYMNGVTYTGEAALPSVPDLNWRIANR